MRYLAVILILTSIVAAGGCRKKKELTPWQKYQAGAEQAINSLKDLSATDLDKVASQKFQAQLAKTEAVVQPFLQQSQTEAARASRTEIDAAMQDFHFTVQLTQRKEQREGDHYFANKLFASTDAELFAKAKQRYQLGPELVVASQPYYFIDSVIHEAWRSASRHIDRATAKLNEETAAEVKAARAAKKAQQQGQQSPTPTPSPSATPTPQPTPTPSTTKPAKSAKSH